MVEFDCVQIAPHVSYRDMHCLFCGTVSCIRSSVVETDQLTYYWEDILASVGATLPTTTHMGLAILLVSFL